MPYLNLRKKYKSSGIVPSIWLSDRSNLVRYGRNLLGKVKGLSKTLFSGLTEKSI